MFEQSIDIERIGTLINLFGNFDENMKRLEKQYGVQITSHGSQVKVRGEVLGVTNACRAIDCFLTMLNKGEQLTPQSMECVFSMVEDGEEDKITSITDADCICVTSKGRPVKPKTLGQKRYVESIQKNTITIGVGPAGTGKTYLAVALAVQAFRAKQINRIVLTRPAVEAGESLGFLPGDLQQKVDPYLRPLYDALFDMLGAENFQRCQERGDIEVAPLAYMRGRTLEDRFIMLDEAQNTTGEQMKMFLTRLGVNSKAVVTGDITQIDLPRGKRSGLIEAVKVLKGIDDISTVLLSAKDVVRHHLIQEIIKAYERAAKTAEHEERKKYER
ncbi:MAG: PhoH family protein [Clostridia bacterium]|nr:PhoH family protein [Clostridia bacterium]